MSDIVLANELYIQYDGQTIACTTDFTLQVSKETIDVNCGTGWTKGLGSLKEWSLDFSAIVKRADTNLIYSEILTDLIFNEVPVTVALRSNIANDSYYTGQAMLLNLTKSGTIDDVVTYSGTLQGYNQLSILTEGAPTGVFDPSFDNTFA